MSVMERSSYAPLALNFYANLSLNSELALLNTSLWCMNSLPDFFDIQTRDEFFIKFHSHI